MRLNYSGLDATARLRDKRNREAWEAEVLASIEDMRGELARLAPNLKVRLTGCLLLVLLLSVDRRCYCCASTHTAPLPSSPLSFASPPPQAVEQYEAIRDKERAQLEELEAARGQAKAAAEAFQEVQQRRYDAFTAAFGHVAKRIDSIYKVRFVL